MLATLTSSRQPQLLLWTGKQYAEKYQLVRLTVLALAQQHYLSKSDMWKEMTLQD